ncbi:hypothetical protein H311_00308 [Anncaliia algerae PRA109]|nr:hypothetical protein H311_00308 [Anncaliia algerae PRA109]
MGLLILIIKIRMFFSALETNYRTLEYISSNLFTAFLCSFHHFLGNISNFLCCFCEFFYAYIPRKVEFFLNLHTIIISQDSISLKIFFIAIFLFKSNKSFY